MNNKLKILIIALLFFGCRGPVKEENKNNASASSSLPIEKKKYVVNTKQSFVVWKGSNLIGSNSHTGYVYISKGELIIENGQLIRWHN